MFPHTDASPLDGQSIHFAPDTLVFDTIYNPPETKLLRIAREDGAKTIAGDEMFIRQAAAQFKIFVGTDAPTQVMRDALVTRLVQLSPPRSG
jgi:3-dehydroquinate dehydratase/shikimate dehydrogenase